MESPGVSDVRCFSFLLVKKLSRPMLPSLGRGIVESQGCLWPLVSSSVQGPHQPPGIACSLPSPAVFFVGSSSPSCPHSVQKHLDSFSPEPSRWHKVAQVTASHAQGTHLVSSLTSLVEGCLPSGVKQPGSGCSFEGSSAPGGMEASPGRGADDMAAVWQSRGGSFCNAGDHSLPLVVCKNREIQPAGAGCYISRVGKMSTICIPSSYTAVGNIAQDISVQPQSVTCSAPIASQALVSHASITIGGQALAASVSEESVATDG